MRRLALPLIAGLCRGSTRCQRRWAPKKRALRWRRGGVVISLASGPLFQRLNPARRRLESWSLLLGGASCCDYITYRWRRALACKRVEKASWPLAHERPASQPLREPACRPSRVADVQGCPRGVWASLQYWRADWPLGSSLVPLRGPQAWVTLSSPARRAQGGDFSTVLRRPRRAPEVNFRRALTT